MDINNICTNAKCLECLSALSVQVPERSKCSSASEYIKSNLFAVGVLMMNRSVITFSTVPCTFMKDIRPRAL